MSVDILPRTPGYILTEALFAGGCFGGDGTFGQVQMADPEEVRMVFFFPCRSLQFFSVLQLPTDYLNLSP